MERTPLKQVVISSSDGNLLAQAEMPDGKETCMSVVVSKMYEDEEYYTIVFGESGGETFGGNLYRSTNLQTDCVSHSQ